MHDKRGVEIVIFKVIALQRGDKLLSIVACVF